MFTKKNTFLLAFALFFSSTISFAEPCASLYQEQDFQSAKTQCLEEARLNSTHAYYILGQLYANGYGVEKDTNKALSYYRLAVLNNDTNSQIALGKYHEKQKHYLQSHIFFTLAIDNGSLIAQKHKDKVEQHLSLNDLKLSRDYFDLVKDAIIQRTMNLAVN